MQWIFQIYLWCNTRCSPGGILLHIKNKHRWDSNLESNVLHSVRSTVWAIYTCYLKLHDFFLLRCVFQGNIANVTKTFILHWFFEAYCYCKQQLRIILNVLTKSKKLWVEICIWPFSTYINRSSIKCFWFEALGKWYTYAIAKNVLKTQYIY